MAKTHNCLIKITNNSGMEMQLCRDWFDSKWVADGFDWPPVIKNGSHICMYTYVLMYSYVCMYVCIQLYVTVPNHLISQ